MAEVKDLVITYPDGELIFNPLPGTDEAYAELDLQNISTNQKIAFKINTVDLFEVVPKHGVIDPDSSFKVAVTFKSTSVSMFIVITLVLTDLKAKADREEPIPRSDGQIYTRCPSLTVIVEFKGR